MTESVGIIDTTPKSPIVAREREGSAEAWVWAAAMLPFLFLAIRQWSFGYGMTAGDYAQYLLHAAAVSRGDHYGNIGYIFTQYNPLIGPPAEPPGLPLTLAPILALAGANLTLIRLIIAGSAAVFLALCGRYVARREGFWVAAGVVMLTGVALETQYATSNVLSDLGFAALVWGVIACADANGAWTWRRVAIVTVLGLLAIAYRTAGVALVPAMVLFAIVSRERRSLVPVGVWGGLGLVVVIVVRAEAMLAGMLRVNVVTLAHTALANALAYRSAIFDALLRPTPSRLINGAYFVIAACLVMLGAVQWLRRSWRSFLFCFVVAYVAMLLVAPVRESRYLWPLFPMVELWLLLGLKTFVAVLRPNRPRAERVVLATAAVISACAIGVHLTKPAPVSFPDLPPVRRLFAEVQQIARQQRMRAVFVNPRVLTWNTRVPAMGTFIATPQQTLSELEAKRISHVIVGDMGTAPAADSSVRRVIEMFPQRFTRVYSDSVFAIYRVVE